jgi:transketolase
VFESFGWSSRTIDGHDLAQLDDALEAAQNSDEPMAIICQTIKGRGVSFMEDDNNWHYRAPNQDEFERAMKELALRYA